MKKILLLPILFFCLLFTGCKKNTEAIQQSNKSTELKGNVMLYDEGNQIQNPAGITVSIDNSVPVASSQTDKDGKFTLSVPYSLDSFSVSYSNPKIGTFKRYFFRDAQGKFYYKDSDGNIRGEDSFDESLGYKSSVIVNSFDLQLVNDSTLRVKCNISSPNKDGEKYVRLLIQKGLPDISINTVDKSDINTYGILIPVEIGDNNKDYCLKCSGICQNWLKEDQVFMTAYGDSWYSNIYIDRQSGQLTFPNLHRVNNSSIASFNMPF